MARRASTNPANRELAIGGVAELRRRLGLLEEAFIYARSIDFGTYERQRDKIQEDLAVADLELHEARIDSIDVDGVLGFAEHLIANAARAWMEANLEQRQQIQSAIFPEGLPFDGREFGTAPENGMASLSIPSWNQIAGFLESMRRLRDATGLVA